MMLASIVLAIGAVSGLLYWSASSRVAELEAYHSRARATGDAGGALEALLAKSDADDAAFRYGAVALLTVPLGLVMLWRALGQPRAPVV